ncbi:hypothetical protein HaLaN_19197, partial [Haematococcus lacustris]
MEADILDLSWPGTEANEDEPVDVDENLSAADILGRIEEFVANWVNSVASGSVPALQLHATSTPCVVALGDKVQERSLVANQGAAAYAYTR